MNKTVVRRRMMGIAQKPVKVVRGFVVKREYFEEDETTRVRAKHRKQIGRVFQSRDAAETLMALLKKEHPDWDLYVHDKTGYDGLGPDA